MIWKQFQTKSSRQGQRCQAKASSLARQVISAMINRCTKVPVESDSEGFSGSYLRVRVTGKVGLGDFVPVRITGKEKEGLVGEKI